MLSVELFGAIGAQYRGESELLVAMGPLLVLSALAPLPSIALNQIGHAGERLRVAAITLAINLVLDLALVPSLGAWGAVVGTTVAFTFYFVRHHRLLDRALREGVEQPGLHVREVVVRAILVATGAALLAAAIRGTLDAAGAPSDIVVLLAAGGPPVLLVAWWASRIVLARAGRRPSE